MPSDRVLARADLPFQLTLSLYARPHKPLPYLIQLHRNDDIFFIIFFRDISTAKHYFDRFKLVFYGLGQFFSELDTFFRLIINSHITHIYISSFTTSTNYIEIQVSNGTDTITFIIDSYLTVKSFNPSKTDPSLTATISDLVSDYKQILTDLFSTLTDYTKYRQTIQSQNI
ncbi:MAG: hypothetical protein DRQ10_04710 [Candidatus Hydrothermota bacterium]|nr:MAG: hypothetical protein DRQ10_04710 [Candidatus Hydrothermae bacterium]